MEKQMNIPKLRFPEFTGEWEIKKLEEMTEKIGDGLHGTPIYAEDSDIYFINGNNLTNGKIEINENTKKVEEHIFEKNNKGLNKNTILISINGTIGNIAKYNNEKVMLGKSVGYFNFKENIDFYYHLFNTDTVQNFFISELTGSTIKNLSLKTLRETKIFFPTIPEQKRIASFFTVLDKKIAELKQKKTLLEQYKKGIMQKLFSQELRFKDENGKEFPKWEKLKLGEICDYKNGGAFENQLSEDGKYYLISLNSLDITGKLKQEHKRLNFTDNSLQKGDLVMVLSDVAHGNFLGLTDIIPNDNFVLNQRMGALKPKIEVDRFYLKTFINNNQKYFKLKGQGSSQQNLSKGDIENFDINLPCLEEQTKIANFLSAIDEKINRTENQIQQTQQYKKGLLQKMFV